MGFLSWLHITSYSLAKVVFGPLIRMAFFVKVEGTEHFPQHGGVILASNHLSVFDPPVVAAAAPRNVHFLAKEELFVNPPVRAMLTWLLAFPIKRGSSDRQALKQSIGILEAGHVLLIFPEGTRQYGGRLVKIERGIGLVAMRSGVPVVPVYIKGKYNWFRSVTIKFGKPFYVTKDSVQEHGSREDLSRAADMILAHMRELMEENQTGTTDH